MLNFVFYKRHHQNSSTKKLRQIVVRNSSTHKHNWPTKCILKCFLWMPLPFNCQYTMDSSNYISICPKGKKKGKFRMNFNSIFVCEFHFHWQIIYPVFQKIWYPPLLAGSKTIFRLFDESLSQVKTLQDKYFEYFGRIFNFIRLIRIEDRKGKERWYRSP